MAIFAADTIGGTPGQELSATTPSGGGTWTKNTAFGAGTTVISDVNRARSGAATDVQGAYYHSGTPATAEYDVEADIRIVQQDSGYAATILGRMSTSAADGYWAEINGNTWQLYRVQGGSFTSLGSWVHTGLADGTTVHIKLEIRNATKKLFVATVERISSTDNVITAAGKAGVSTWGSFAGDNAWGYHLDNFTAQDPGGASVNIDPNRVDLTASVFNPTVQTQISAILSGSILSATTEADIVSGGRIATIRLTGATFKRGVVPFPIAPARINLAAQVFDPSFDEPLTGLDFPGNAGGISPAFIWNVGLGGLAPMARSPATYIWRSFPRTQAGFWTFLFRAQYMTTWDGGTTYRYFGAHPYPFGGFSRWEISMGGADDFESVEVTWNTWHINVLTINGLVYKFYPTWPNRTRLITSNDPNGTEPTDPIIIVGDAPWNAGMEIPNAILRGFQYYDALLSLDDIDAEVASPGSVLQPWYLRMNPKPTVAGIQDQSGRDNHPIWWNADRPTLWEA